MPCFLMATGEGLLLAGFGPARACGTTGTVFPAKSRLAARIGIGLEKPYQNVEAFTSPILAIPRVSDWKTLAQPDPVRRSEFRAPLAEVGNGRANAQNPQEDAMFPDHGR